MAPPGQKGSAAAAAEVAAAQRGEAGHWRWRSGEEAARGALQLRLWWLVTRLLPLHLEGGRLVVGH